MKFIMHQDIEPGDTIAWAYDGKNGSTADLIFYKVKSIERKDMYTTVIHGKSYNANGMRHDGIDRDWDVVPFDRDILLIKRKV